MNPFTPSFGVSPPLLVGRDEPLEDFRAALAAAPGDPHRAVLLTGVRGSGKTVLLNAFEDEARRRRWAVISETTRPGIADEIESSTLPDLLAEAGATTHVSTIEGITLSAAGFGGGVTRRRTESHPPVPSLRSQLTSLADIHDARGAGVLVSIDEVHRTAVDDLRAIAQAVQHLFREGRQVAFVAAGLPSSVADILNDDVLTFLRRAERFELASVPTPDVSRALIEPIENSGRRITDDATAIAAAGTAGYPFLIQLVGYHTWAIDPDAEIIDAEQARAGVRRAARRIGRLVHEPALAGLSAVDRSFLAAMAEDDSASRMADVAARLGVSSSYASQYRARLISAQVIVASGRGYVDFAMPYLRQYLREHTSPGSEGTAQIREP